MTDAPTTQRTLVLVKPDGVARGLTGAILALDLDDGLVIRRLRANLYGSPEYFTVQGGGTNATYVAAAYRDIFEA